MHISLSQAGPDFLTLFWIFFKDEKKECTFDDDKIETVSKPFFFGIKSRHSHIFWITHTTRYLDGGALSKRVGTKKGPGVNCKEECVLYCV